jgi:signal transduction histidine kinase
MSSPEEKDRFISAYPSHSFTKGISGFVTVNPAPPDEIPVRMAPVKISIVPSEEPGTKRDKVLEFVRFTAHEVNNAMGAILASSEFLALDNDPTPNNLENVDTITTASNRVIALMRKLSLILHGVQGFEMEFNHVSLSYLIKNIQTSHHIKSGLITFLSVDKVCVDDIHFERVIENLVINALRYGRPPIIIRSYTENDSVVIKVIDYGDGLTDDPEDLFGLYKQGKNGDFKKGTGVGLYYCRTICKAHGGTITAENCPQGGAMFTIRIPQRNPSR